MLAHWNFRCITVAGVSITSEIIVASQQAAFRQCSTGISVETSVRAVEIAS